MNEGTCTNHGRHTVPYKDPQHTLQQATVHV